ncbi:putative integral membrane protein [Alloactinosynnema sp. L-07]|uniref:DUF4190 domain-containing protein n=1 Tax=Alloactinosynnema sp. L-07 TaxID=1653480 RepID=UPI00065F0057|nr:DUF4190 domain-containing protein [Alloactinosynnema sp. L-07]CRK59787.1 putative integral membrane protein [Alloactinosynnema sp. L-07]
MTYPPQSDEPYGQPAESQPGSYGYAPQAPAYPQQGYPAQAGYHGPAAPQNGLGTAGFVTGLLGLILFWVPLIGLVLAIIGVSLSGVGMAKANRGEANNKGLAIAGLVCGVIGVTIWLIAFIAVASS